MCSVGLAVALDDVVVLEELTIMLLLLRLDVDESFEDVEVETFDEELNTEVDDDFELDEELRVELVEATVEEVFTDELEVLITVDDFEDKMELTGTELDELLLVELSTDEDIDELLIVDDIRLEVPESDDEIIEDKVLLTLLETDDSM